MSLVTNDYKLKIIELKKKRGATIFTHNYQRPEVQDIADYVGDSLGLSTNAARTEQETIVFCRCTFLWQKPHQLFVPIRWS